MSDEHSLIQASQGGDREAFTSLVEAHYDAVSAYIASRCPRPGLLEEIVQEAFVRAWQQCERFNYQSSVRTWLIGIARNVYREQMRKRETRLQHLDHLLSRPQVDGDENDLIGDQVSAQVEAMKCCITKLSERNQKLLIARYQDGRTLKEMAIAFKKKTSALSRHLQRLANDLRQCIEGKAS